MFWILLFASIVGSVGWSVYVMDCYAELRRMNNQTRPRLIPRKR